jgi:hypothetical protein
MYSLTYSLSHLTINRLFPTPIPVAQNGAGEGDLFKISLEKMFLTRRPSAEWLAFEEKIKSLGIARTKPLKSRKSDIIAFDMTAPPSSARELRSPSIFSRAESQELRATSIDEPSPVPSPNVIKKKAPCSNWKYGICKGE